MSRILGILVLSLLAVAAGGCSLVFTPMFFNSSGSFQGFALLWLAGVVIAGLSIWGIVHLVRSA